ncbi:fibrocystin-L-like [Dendropsophus ebraccatus]|uniref:fibrocystin-L-like n=1 Tax=Dendropsophus ebraccatus TaxID=150705 RepID=UPI003831FE1A
MREEGSLTLETSIKLRDFRPYQSSVMKMEDDGQVTVSQVTPYYGSVNGGTRVTIRGRGFADANQFNYGDGNSNLGNSVQFVSSTLSFPCDVEKVSSHATQIICYTRLVRGPTTLRWVEQTFQDFPEEPCITVGYFSFLNAICPTGASMSYTPRISSITPLSGRPGSLITITGTIFTDAYGSNAISSNGNNVKVLRAYAGGMPCNLLVPNTDTLSLPDLATYFVSSVNKFAMYQTYAEITGIFPSSGSIQGGTIVTISGQYFDQTDTPAKVLIGGQECQILGLKDKTITCRSPPQPSVLPSLFPGSRGLKLERWSVGVPSLSDAVTFNESSTGYAGASWYDGASISWSWDPFAFVARLSGFFVPPETDYYNFYIKGTGYSALYFNESGDPAGKVQIAYSYYSYSYYYYSSQKSKTFYLQAGKPHGDLQNASSSQGN